MKLTDMMLMEYNATNLHSLPDRQVSIHPNGSLQLKPWGQKEFALLDPDHNLLTFGQSS